MPCSQIAFLSRTVLTDIMSTPRCLQHLYQCLCTSFSILLNSFLIVLIVWKSPKKMGDYKYLMVYTSVFESVYTVLDLLAEPTAYSHGYAFVVFRRYNGTWTDSITSQTLIITWCGFFGASMAVFGVHFLYRFGSLHHTNSVFFAKILELYLRNVYFLFIIPIVYLVWWTAVCLVYCRYSIETYQYMSNLTETLYSLDITDINYISAVFYIANTDGSLAPNKNAFLAMCQFSIMVGSSMLCVFYLGARCYSKIKSQLKQATAQSQFTSALHKQLFFALVGQTVIPLTLMYIPICVFFFCPLLNINVGVVSTFLTHTVTLYPAIDPLPNMFIIKNYRNAIKELWKKFKTTAHLTYKHKSTVATVTSVHSFLKHRDSVFV